MWLGISMKGISSYPKKWLWMCVLSPKLNPKMLKKLNRWVLDKCHARRTGLIWEKQSLELVPQPNSINIIGTKWIYKNMSDENGNLTRNRARLVSWGYTQIEGVNFDETFTHVALLESIRLLLEISYLMKFKLYQMNFRSAFLNGFFD